MRVRPPASGDQANVTRGERAKLPACRSQSSRKPAIIWSRRAIRQVSNKYAACSTSGM
jgi:hypothetical protein